MNLAHFSNMLQGSNSDKRGEWNEKIHWGQSTLHLHRLRKLSEKNRKDVKACLSFANRFETAFEIWQLDIFTRCISNENFYTSHVWREFLHIICMTWIFIRRMSGEKWLDLKKKKIADQCPQWTRRVAPALAGYICKWQIYCCQHKRCCSWCEISIYV